MPGRQTALGSSLCRAGPFLSSSAGTLHPCKSFEGSLANPFVDVSRLEFQTGEVDGDDGICLHETLEGLAPLQETRRNSGPRPIMDELFDALDREPEPRPAAILSPAKKPVVKVPCLKDLRGPGRALAQSWQPKHVAEGPAASFGTGSPGASLLVLPRPAPLPGTSSVPAHPGPKAWLGAVCATARLNAPALNSQSLELESGRVRGPESRGARRVLSSMKGPCSDPGNPAKSAIPRRAPAGSSAQAQMSPAQTQRSHKYLQSSERSGGPRPQGGARCASPRNPRRKGSTIADYLVLENYDLKPMSLREYIHFPKVKHNPTV